MAPPHADPDAGGTAARWPQGANAAIALWLLSSPPTLGHASTAMIVSDLASGTLLLCFCLMAARRAWAAWASCGVGLWVMSAPLVFWSSGAAEYNNDTLLGALIVVFSVIVPRLDLEAPRTRPPGWTYNPSAWPQRLPIVLLALVGFFLSRYMAAYQLEHIDTVWDPFFGDGTERVLTSEISRAFPVSDAGLGALSYLIDALAGLLGGRRRWRTMPWMVLLFGFFVIPPGVISIVLVILQPIGVGAWCFVCLVTAVVMLMMVPPALDEVIATCQFLRRVRRERQSLWRAVWFGEAAFDDEPADTARRATWSEVCHAVEIFSMPWNLIVSALLGVWLMAAPGVQTFAGPLATSSIVVGALVVTAAVIAAAEPARIVRLGNIPCGIAMVVAPWLVAGPGAAVTWGLIATGIALVFLSLPKGKVADHYGAWDRWIV